MEPLSGLDAGFLYMETPAVHMHTIKIVVLAQREDREALGFDAVKRSLAAHLPKLPPFRRRLVEIPGGLGHPVWVDDPGFVLDHHLIRLDARAPGGQRELEELVSEFAGRPLDRRRPLWEMAVVEGLAEGRCAVITKLHHTLADGVAAHQMLLDVVDGGPAPSSEVRSEPPPPPTRSELLAFAAREHLLRLRRTPRLVLETLRGLWAMRRHAVSSGVKAAVPFRGPRTRFNRSLSSNRRFATAKLPLHDVLRVKQHFGVTVNDVVLAICSAAVRDHLAARSELPERALLVGVPVSTRVGAGEARHWGNHLGHIFGSLCTDERNPVERLRAIAAVMRDAKARHAALGPTVFERWTEFTPPMLYSAFVRAWSRLRMADRIPPPINLVVSNVAGPRRPLEIDGVTLLDLYSVGPILEGIGLNITGWSYVDTLYLAALACPEHLPDLHELTARLAPALAELVEAATQNGTGPRRVAA